MAENNYWWGNDEDFIYKILKSRELFCPCGQFFVKSLKKKYNVIVDVDKAQIVICDMWGKEYLDCILPKISNTAEITGVKRWLHLLDQYYWRKKQRMKYKLETLLEKIGYYY